MRRVLALVAALTMLAACGGGKDDKKPKPTTSSTGAATTTPAVVAPGTSPLTGLPADPAKLARPLLVVKIDNAPKAHPQAGINQADIVIEEGVEGGITRFFTLFHSADSDPVGPVRSARSTDMLLASALNKPLFAYSGASREFEALVDASPVVNVGPRTFPGGYFRQPGRPAPYNYFSRTTALFGRAPAGATAPPPLFSFGEPQKGDATNGIHIEFRGRVVTLIDWVWDGGAHVWKRTNNGSAHVDAAGQQATATNLVVQFVEYKDTGHRDQSGEPVPEAQLLGEGEAWVFTNGQVIKGRWQKPNPLTVTKYLDASGQAIRLAPGRTWVELPKPGMGQLK